MTSQLVTDPQKIAQMIRTRSPNAVDIRSEVRKDLKQTIFNNSKNTIDFYNVKSDIMIPKKLIPAGFPATYKSVSILPQTKARKVIEERFKDPQYNRMEKEVLREIRQDQGNIGLLSDLYKELSKHGESPRSKKLVKSSSRTVLKNSDVAEVEDLDNWANQKIHNEEPIHNSEIEEMRKVVARMILFIEEEGLTHCDKNALNSIFEEMDASSKRSIVLPSLNDTKRGTNKSILGEITKGIQKTKNSSGVVKALKLKEEDDYELKYIEACSTMFESLDYNSSTKMGLKLQLSYYKSIHEPVEQRIAKHIKYIEAELEKKGTALKKLFSEKNEAEEKRKQIIRMIEEAGCIKSKEPKVQGKRPRVTFLPCLVVTEDSYKKSLEERDRIMDLRDEIEGQNELISQKETEIKKIEAECGSLRKRLKVFHRIKVKLQFKILKHGYDCREEGIVWVLKILLKEGENITYDDLPMFLDHASKAHIMQKAKLLNELGELRATESSMVASYKTKFEGNFYNSRFNTILSLNNINKNDLRASPGSLRDAFNHKERKVRTVNEVNDGQNTKLSYQESINSLNELDLEVIGADSSLGEICSNEKSGNSQTILTQRAKASSLTYIEEKDEENGGLNGSLDYKVQKGTATFSMNSLRPSKNNLNENLYKEAKLVIKQLCKDQNALEKPRNGNKKNNEHIKPVEANTENPVTKEDFIAKIKLVQSDISQLVQKIRDADQKEGSRIVKDFNHRTAQVELEFYLACVLGVSQAEKFFYRFALKRSPL